MAARYDVYISYADEDKHTIALPVYNSLRRRGIRVFMDRLELTVSGAAVAEVMSAMSTALIGLFILSPEFVANAWTMRELFCFKGRRDQVDNIGIGEQPPLLIPVFFRLTVAETRYRLAFKKYPEVYARHGFMDRLDKGEVSMSETLDVLAALSAYTGIECYEESTSSSGSSDASERHSQLVQRICDVIAGVLEDKFPRATRPSSNLTLTVETRREFAKIISYDVAKILKEEFVRVSGVCGTCRKQLRAPEGSVPYDVFISHAGPDKYKLAYPLREALTSLGMKCFLDEESLCASTKTNAQQIYEAIRGSRSAMFVLSVDFVARKWPMREFQKFTQRIDSEDEDQAPVLFPLFYGLSVEQCSDSNLPRREEFRDEFEKKGFFSDDYQLHFSLPQAMALLKRATSFVGVRNDQGETDDAFAQRAAKALVAVLKEKSRLKLQSGVSTEEAI